MNEGGSGDELNVNKEINNFDNVDFIVYVDNQHSEDAGILETLSVQENFNESIEDSNPLKFSENTTTQILLSEKEVSCLESNGYVILYRNYKRYLLDSEGLKEMVTELDNETSNLLNEENSDNSQVLEIDSQPSMKTDLSGVELKYLPLDPTQTNSESQVCPMYDEIHCLSSTYEIPEKSVINCDKENEAIFTSLDVTSQDQNLNNESKQLKNLKTYVEDSTSKYIYGQITISKSYEVSNDMEWQNFLQIDNSINKDFQCTNTVSNESIITKEVANKNSISSNNSVKHKVYPLKKNANKIDKHSNARNNEKSLLLEGNKMYMGVLPNGKKVYGRIIDVKSPDGIEITKDKLDDLSAKIKNSLGKVIQISDLIYNNTNVSENVAEEGNKIFIENTTSTEEPVIAILYPNNDQSRYQLIDDYNKSHNVIFCNELDSDTKKAEFEIVRKIIQNMVRCIKLTLHKNQNEYHKMLNKDIIIYKSSTSKINEDGNDFLVDHVFFGKMNGSFDEGWEFSHLHNSKPEANIDDYFIIKIISDETLPENSFADMVIFEKYALQAISEIENVALSNENDIIPVTCNETLSNKGCKYDVKKVNGKTQYRCKICKKYFQALTHCKRHLKIHSTTESDNIIKCHLCDCTFYHHSTLTRHIVKLHRNEATYTRN